MGRMNHQKFSTGISYIFTSETENDRIELILNGKGFQLNSLNSDLYKKMYILFNFSEYRQLILVVAIMNLNNLSKTSFKKEINIYNRIIILNLVFILQFIFLEGSWVEHEMEKIPQGFRQKGKRMFMIQYNQRFLISLPIWLIIFLYFALPHKI